MTHPLRMQAGGWWRGEIRTHRARRRLAQTNPGGYIYTPLNNQTNIQNHLTTNISTLHTFLPAMCQTMEQLVSKVSINKSMKNN